MIHFSCEANHWGLARGTGCDACDCDPVGSLSETCNEFDGSCQCKEGFGGRQCNECQTNFYGDPNVECYPCDCDPLNSQSLQCDYKTGECTCFQGMTFLNVMILLLHQFVTKKQMPNFIVLIFAVVVLVWKKKWHSADLASSLFELKTTEIKRMVLEPWVI